MVAKRFFYICAGLLCLALAYHLGAKTATAQAGSTVTGFSATDISHESGGIFYVMTPNGDVYGRAFVNGAASPLNFLGNYWSGGPTPAAQETWGGVKSRYRKGAGAAQDR